MKHAYLIMAHNEWDMLNKLIQALDYPNNDIYLHIDKKADLKKVNIYKTKYLDYNCCNNTRFTTRIYNDRLYFQSSTWR
jgi:hypothetical protein